MGKIILVFGSDQEIIKEYQHSVSHINESSVLNSSSWHYKCSSLADDSVNLTQNGHRTSNATQESWLQCFVERRQHHEMQRSLLKHRPKVSYGNPLVQETLAVRRAAETGYAIRRADLALELVVVR